MLESIWNYTNVNQVQELVLEFAKDTPSDWQKDREQILTRCSHVFRTKKLEVIGYLTKAVNSRIECICMSTLNGLGVVYDQSTTQ